MRWFLKYDRVVKRFALFPVIIDNEIRWLETVYLRQSYDKYDDKWRNTMFVSKAIYLQYKEGKSNNA